MFDRAVLTHFGPNDGKKERTQLTSTRPVRFSAGKKWWLSREPYLKQEGYGPIDFPALVYNWLHLVTCGHNCSQLPYGPN